MDNARSANKSVGRASPGDGPTWAFSLAGRGPQYRAEADRLERPDPEEVRVQRPRHDVHHRAEGVDHEEVVREERGREEEEREAERGLRPRVHAAVHGQQDCGEDDVCRADGEAAQHQETRHRPTPFTRRTWTYPTISPESPSRRFRLLADRLEDRVVAFEVGRQEVGGRVRVPDRPGDEPVLLKEVEVMPDRAIVEGE